MSQLKGVLCKNKNAKRAGVNEAQGWLKEICEGGKVVASAGRESQKLGKRLRYSGRAVLRENVWQTGEDACSRREYRRYILRRHSVLRKMSSQRGSLGKGLAEKGGRGGGGRAEFYMSKQGVEAFTGTRRREAEREGMRIAFQVHDDMESPRKNATN